MSAMHSDTQAPDASGGDSEQAWRTLAIVTAILAVEGCVVGWFFGGWLLAIPGKRVVAIALVGMLGGLWAQIEQHRAEYRSARVYWPLIAGQLLSFAGVLAALGGLSTGALRLAPGDWGTTLAVTLPAAAWLACSLAGIAPSRALAWTLIGSAAVCGVFAVAAWNMGDLTQSFWSRTGDTTVTLVELLLRPFAGGPVVRPEPFIIGTDAFQVRIAPACSGFHGIGLITVLLAGYLWWFRRLHRFPQSLLLLPVGIALVWLANVVRITSLILVGIWISPEIAVDGFHSTAGWIAFLTVGLGIIWAASRMPFFTRAMAAPIGMAEESGPPLVGQGVIRADVDAGHPANTPAVACLVPFLALTAVTMLTRAFTSGFDLLYPVRVVCVAAVLLYLRRSYAWREWQISPVAVAIGVVAFAAWIALTHATADASNAHIAEQNSLQLDPYQLGKPWAVLWLLFRIVGSVVTVPIAEELFFRGFVIRRCIAEDTESVPEGEFSWFSFLASSAAFGFLHGEAWLAGIVAGMLFAAALYWRRRIRDAVVAHATTNALLSGYVIATGSWSEWG